MGSWARRSLRRDATALFAAIFVPLTVILEFEGVMRGFPEAEPVS